MDFKSNTHFYHEKQQKLWNELCLFFDKLSILKIKQICADLELKIDLSIKDFTIKNQV